MEAAGADYLERPMRIEFGSALAPDEPSPATAAILLDERRLTPQPDVARPGGPS
jgi:hypothetical protein